MSMPALFYEKSAAHRIDYAGGSIRFSVKKYGLNNVRVFQRSIFARKDKM